MEPEPSTSARDLGFELEVLNMIDGITGAKDFGVEGGTGQYGVRMDVRPAPEASRKPKRIACSGDKPTKLDAVAVAKQYATNIFGNTAVEAAERLVCERRAAAGTSAGVQRTVNAVLGKTQQLQAQLRAAETRAAKAETAAEHAEREAAEAVATIIREPEAARRQAWQDVEAARAALDAHTKRQCIEHEPPAVKEPAWRSRPYVAYDTVQKWVEYAGIPRYRYDEGECTILLRCYFHRTADDCEGLTFLRWPGKAGEKLVINSSELRAVQGRQECDFKLTLPQGSPQLRQQQSRAKKKPQTSRPPIDPKQRWRLERDLDRDTRRVCEAT